MPEDFTPFTGDGDAAGSFDEFIARYLAGERARAERSIDLTRFLSARTQDVLQRAGRFALERGQHELDALHVLHVLVEQEPVRDAVRRIGADPRRDQPRRGAAASVGLGVRPMPMVRW